MGVYEPVQKRRRRSVADTLAEAEQEHYLDCPNADLPIRAAALLLDLILFSLASSGIQQLAEAVKNSLPAMIGTVSQPAEPIVILALNYLIWVIKTTVFFLYFLWSVLRFGGSPAKLIMGLRVVDVNSGDRLNFFQVLVRETIGKPLGAITLITFLTCVFRKDRRGLHDLMSGSTVKKVRGGP